MEQSKTFRLIYKSLLIKKLLKEAEKSAHGLSPVLVTGESGTGKELLTEYIYSKSDNPTGPLIKVNCSAIPENLLEMELFGSEKGSFTDAEKTRSGLVDKAQGGLLFFDEVGELPLHLQSKILRFVETGEFRRVGGDTQLNVTLKIVAATNRNLQQMLSKGLFRKDLYYRLAVFHLIIPPLNSRKEDIPLLADFFVKRYNPRISIGVSALHYLLTRDWPGNVRELENAIQRAILLKSDNSSDGDSFDELMESDFSGLDKSETDFNTLTYREHVFLFKKYLLEHILQKHNGNRTKAAAELKIQRTYLVKLINEMKITE